MATPRRTLGLSAQQVDPLSWFTGPFVPLTFSVLVFLYGGISSVVTWQLGGLPWLQPIATVMCAGAGVLIHFRTRPLRQRIGWTVGVLSLALATCGVILSAIGYSGTDFAIEQWWAPSALALTIASLGPYLPVRRILVLGPAATALVVVVTYGILHPTSAPWGPIGIATIIAYTPVLGIVATVIFSWNIVSTMLEMLESPSRIMVAGQTVRDEAAERIERVTLARLNARAVPFLEGIAAAGRITPADRALAGQFARRLRDDLVTQSTLSWLDTIASESRLVVVDPDRRAQRMTNPQRTALRGLLRAILDTPGIDSGSLMVDLRAAPDGATAVGVSLDIALPEGLRIMHLAPYYLTLRTAVEDLRVQQDSELHLSFKIPEKN